MPNGFWYARGPYGTNEAIPASAFSKGDLLTYDSDSSLSRINELMPSGADIAGIALADSNDSINDRVPYLIPRSGTLFWSRLSTAVSSLTPGFEADVFFDTSLGRYYVEPGSTNSVRVAVRQGTEGVGEVDQSVQSKALVELIGHAGNLDHS